MVTINLDDMLILSHAMQEPRMSRDIVRSPADFGVCNKYKEINFAPMSY